MQHEVARRSLLSGFGAAVATFAFGSRTAHAQASAPAFQPAHHADDDWLGERPGKHRIFIDSSSAAGGGSAVLYANNLYVAHKDAYALPESDLAIVVCLRHFSTPFAYGDAIWAKYGQTLSTLLSFTDPQTNQAPSTNLFNSAEYGMSLSNLGNTLDSVISRGTHFAVCDMATHFFSREIASAAGSDAEAVYKELVANAIPNSHFVSAGVVAVTRSQEYGYSLLYAG